VINEESDSDDSDDMSNYDRKEDMTRTMRLHKIDRDNIMNSEEDSRFGRLNKLAGKSRKEDVFGRFKSPMIFGDEVPMSEESKQSQFDDSEDEN
jgi:hypothetical protein